MAKKSAQTLALELMRAAQKKDQQAMKQVKQTAARQNMVLPTQIPELTYTPVQPAKQQTNWYDGLFGEAGAKAPAVSTGQGSVMDGLFAAQQAENAAQQAFVRGFGETAKMGADYFAEGVKSGLGGLKQAYTAVSDLAANAAAASAANQLTQQQLRQGQTTPQTAADVYKRFLEQGYGKAEQKYDAQTKALGEAENARQQALAEQYAHRDSLAAELYKQTAQGLGGMVPTLVTGAVAPGLGLLTSAVQEAGSGYGEARQDGADKAAAGLYGLTRGLAAAGTEKLLGGIPGIEKAGGLADDLITKAAGKLGGKTAQGVARWGMRAAGEGLEEVAEQALGELGAKLTYGKQGSIEQTMRGEKTLPELAAEYGQTFAGGALVGGVLDAAGNAVRGGHEWWHGLFGEKTQQAGDPETNLQATAKNDTSEQPQSAQVDTAKPLLRERARKKQYATAEEVAQFVDYAFAYGRKAREIQRVGGDVASIPKQDGSLPLGKVSDRLAQEIKAQGADISGYTHKLVDNDIRHIDNSHGTRSREKYPVTAEDIKKIPDIIQNYDDVLYVPRSDGRKGIVYVKRHNGVTYYLEQVSDDARTLSNKQMVKVSTGTIPSLPGLRNAINKKWNLDSPPDDAAVAVPRMYVQDVRNQVPTKNVPQPVSAVNPNSVDDSTVNAALQSAARTPVDRRQRHFDQAQVDADILDWQQTKRAAGEDDPLNNLFEGTTRPEQAVQGVDVQPENILNTLFDAPKPPAERSRVLGLETDRAWRTQQLAKELRSEWPGKASQSEVVELLDGVYEQFRAQTDETARRQIAKQAAEEILAQSTRQNRELWDQYPELHGFKVQVPKGGELMSELQYAYGSYAEAKRELAKHGVQLQQVPEGTKSYLDADLQELADMYPEFFNAWDTGQLATVRQMAEAYDTIRPRMENQYGESLEEAVQELAGEIYSGFNRVEPPAVQKTQRTPEQESAAADANRWAEELFPPVEDAPQMPTAREVVDQRDRDRATAQEDFAATAEPPENTPPRVVNTVNEPPSELREVKEIREEGVNMALVDEVTVDEGAYFRDERPYFFDTDRAMEQIAPSNTPAGKYMKRNLLDPFREAKRAYAKNLTENVRAFGQKMRELGIEPGSKQDRELQWFREGVRWVKAKGAAKAEARKYTLAELQADDPEHWKNIVEANKLYGEWTDAYFRRMNETLEAVYPMAQVDVEENIRKMEEQADGALYQRRALEEQLGFYTDAEVNLTRALMNEVREAEAAKARTESYLNRAKEAGKATARAEQSLQQAENRLQRAQHAVAQHPELDEVADLFRRMDELHKREKSTRQMAQNLRKGLENGDALRNRRLPYKENYVPHLKDSVTGLKQLRNILTASDYQIDPQLVGTSEWTKPKSRWAGFMQQRTGEVPYNEGAVQNMLVQMRNYEYKIAFDPIIARSRSIISSLAEATEQSRNANGAIQWLSEWTNDLAGKTSFIDRPVMNIAGRKAMATLRWMNGRVKSNAVMGNLRSALKQVSNLPNGIGYVKNPKDLAAGGKNYTLSHLPGTAGDAARAKLDESAFLAERYGISDVYQQFETKLREKPAQFAAWLMELGDKAVAEYIYLSAYEQGVRLGEESPADYADKITRKTVGGRGVGEQPLILKSQTVNLLAPFQTEILNSFNSTRERFGRKDAVGIMVALVSTAVLSAALGSDAGWNPLGDLMDALKGAGEDETPAETAVRAGKNLLGGAAANMPFGEQVVSMAMDDQTSEALFGDDDPTRYGTANMGLAAFVEPTADVLTAAIDPEKRVTDVDLLGTWGANLVTPYGGAQLRRMRDAGADLGYWQEGLFGLPVPAEDTAAGHYTGSGKLMYPMDSDDPLTNLIAFSMGSGETRYGKANNGEYWSESRTEAYKEAVQSGIDEPEAYNILNELYAVEGDKDASGKTISNSQFVNRAEYIDSLDVTKEQKATLLYNYMGDAKRSHFDAAVNAGADRWQAAQFMVFCATVTSDKDANGKTISGSKKAKVEAELERLKVNGKLREIYLTAAGY